MRCLAAIVFVISATAAADVKLAPDACVNRETTTWRQVRDPILDGTSLRFCTGVDCWSLDRASGKVTATPTRDTPKATPRDPSGTLTDGHGVTLATADDTHVTYCPPGGTCTSIAYKVTARASDVFPSANAALTLGALLYRGVGNNDVESFVLAFDIAHGKLLAQAPGQRIDVLDHGFLVDDTALYSGKFKKVGKLAVPDRVWVPLASSDRVALHDYKAGKILIQDTTTAKVIARIPTGFAYADFYNLVPTTGGTLLYAIGWATNEGKVLVIDVAKAKVTARLSPPVCAAGTHRVN